MTDFSLEGEGVFFALFSRVWRLTGCVSRSDLCVLTLTLKGIRIFDSRAKASGACERAKPSYSLAMTSIRCLMEASSGGRF